MTDVVPLSKPFLPAESHAYVSKAMRSGNVGFSQVYTELVAELLCKKLGRKFCVLTSSGTMALELAYRARKKVHHADEALVPDRTFVATAAAALNAGLDLDLYEHGDPWVTPSSALGGAGFNRSVHVLVPLYGLVSRVAHPDAPFEGFPFDEDLIDAAQAFPAPSLSKTRGDLVLSFFASKAATSGEGGALLTNNEAIYRAASTACNHGRPAASRGYSYESLGTNGRMSDLAAACLLGGLERLEDVVGRRRAITSLYRDRLDGLPVELWPGTDGDFCWQFAFHDKDAARARHAIAAMHAEGVQAREGLPPLRASIERLARDSKQDVWVPAKDKPEDAGLVVMLPTFHDLTIPQIDRVAAAVRRAYS